MITPLKTWSIREGSFNRSEYLDLEHLNMSYLIQNEFTDRKTAQVFSLKAIILAMKIAMPDDIDIHS